MTAKQFIIITTLTFLLSILSCNTESPTEGPDFFIPVFNFKTIDSEPDWSPDGRTIAYHHSGNQLMLLDLESMEKRYLTQGWLPDWSPDSKKIAYVLHGNIHVIDVETKQITQLTQWGSCFFPSWSPDGKRIAYDAITSSVVPVDSAGIWIINANGSVKKQIIRFNGRETDWSPDGKKLLFVQAIADSPPYNEISVVNLIDSSIVRLTYNSFTDRDATWSPDGTKIAWGSYQSGSDEDSVSGIWLMNANGTNQRQLIQSGGYPSWSPDGKQIVYYGTYQDPEKDFQYGTLWLMNADGTNQRPLTTP